MDQAHIQFHPSGPDGSVPSPKADKNSSSSGKNVKFGVIFIVAVAAAFFIWLFVSGKADEFFYAVMNADPGWLALGAVCFLGFYGLDMACYRVAGMLTDTRMGFRDLLSVAGVGIVFAYLTPGQSGAAPAQIVRLTQVGLKVGDASAVQLTKFFIYQAAVTAFGAIVLIARFPYFVERFGDVVFVSVFAFGVHVAIMLGLVAVIFFPNMVRAVCHFLVRVGSGLLHVIKDPDALHARVDEEVDGYAGSVRQAIRQGKVVILAVVVNILQLACLYCIPFCVLRSLGDTSIDFASALCASAFIQLIMTAVPLPGGTGGAEAGFALFFGPELGTLITPAIVLWRALSFYLPIIFSIPMMGLRSTLSPVERHDEFGDVQLGENGLDDTIYVARKNKDMIKDKAGHQIDRANFKAGRKPFVAIKGYMPPDSGEDNLEQEGR